MATYTQAKDDILARITTKWTESGATTENLPLLYGDKEESGEDIPEDESGWGRADVRFGPAIQAGHGDNQKRYRRTGLIFVHVYTPPGEGEVSLDLILQELANAVEGHSTPNGVTFLDFDSKDEGVFGQFQHTRVISSFEFDQVK